MAKKPAKSDDDKKPAKPKAAKGPAPIILLTGSDLHQQHQAIAETKAELIQLHGAIDTFTFDGANARAADVLDELRSFGLIATHKLVILENAEALIKEDTRPMFMRYAEAPSDSATLLLRAGSRWYKSKLDDHVHKIACDGMSVIEAVNFAIASAKKDHHATIDQDAAELLVERLGPDGAMISAELGKLAAAAVTDPKSKEPPLISIEVVAQFVGMRKEEEVWSIQQAILSADRQTILEHIRRLIEVSRAPTTLIHFAIIDLSKKLHGASAGLRAGSNEWAIAKTFKLWGPAKDEVLRVARTVDPERARRMFRAAVEADERVKSGLSDGERTIERLALQLSTLTAKRPAATR